MTQERKGFMCYRSFRDAIKELPIEERLEVYEAIVDYALDKIEPETAKMSGAVRMAWKLIKPTLEADWTRWQNGCQGGAPVGNQNARKQPKTTEKQPKNNQKQPTVYQDSRWKIEDSREEKESKEKSAPMRFTPPTLEEVREFIANNGYTLVNAEAFYNHYEAIGWKVGKNAMKDWHAAVRGWQSREKAQAPKVAEQPQGKRYKMSM